MKKTPTFLDLNQPKKLNSMNLLKKKWYDLNFTFNQIDNTKKALSFPSKTLTMATGSSFRKRKKDTKPKKKKKFVRPGTEFREKIIRIFKGSGDKLDEIQAIKNYYFIRHGVDTLQIAPLNKKLISKIISLMPKNLTHYDEIINSIIEELKVEYFGTMKKAIINYALMEGTEKVKVTKRDRESYKSKMVFIENRQRLIKNLNPINKCLSLIIDLWHTNFGKINFIDVNELKRDGSYDVTDFLTIVTRQIDDTKNFLATNWYTSIQTVIVKKIKKLIFQNLRTSTIKSKKFFRLLAIVMENNLQEVCEKSLLTYTDFICNIENLRQSFQLSIILGESETLVFCPTFFKIQEDILRINDYIIKTVEKFERIENFFVEDLKCTTKYLKPNISAEIIRTCRNRIQDVLEENRIEPELRLQDFDSYLSLMNGTDAENIESFVNGSPKFEEYCTKINYFKTLEREISQNICGVIITGIYEFHREGLIETLEKLARFLQNELITSVTNLQQKEITSVANDYENISKNVLTVPKNTNELMALTTYAKKMESEKIPDLENRLKENMDQLIWLFDYKIFTPLEIKQNSMSFQWYLKMASVFESHKEIIRVKTQEYQETLKRKIESFKRELEMYWEQVQEYENWGEIKSLGKYKKKATVLSSKLLTALERIEEINEEEVSFEWERSQFPLQDQTNEKLKPHKQLFDAGQNFMDRYELWMNTQVGIHEPSVIENEIIGVLKTIAELELIFAEKPATLKLTLDIKNVVDDFKTHLPIIRTLGNCGMRDRHWEQVSEIIGFPIRVSAELTLERVIEYGLDDYIAKFEVISESATKENGLERAMAHMISEWTNMYFNLDPYRDTGTFILSVVDDIQVLLDDHIIKTQTMKNSPYIKPFAKEIIDWESKLILLQEILDDWLNVQQTWMFLEPIFSSPDIQIQMPEEGRRFSSVDKIWKDLMRQVQVDTQVMAVIEIDKMSERLKKAYHLLVVIQKGLNTYLDKKRIYFSRFFFISNDELLEILSETKDPLRIQNYLNKCFSGITTLTFSENFIVEKIHSIEDETIELVNPIVTSNARGQVEKWLLELEKEMKGTIKSLIESAFPEVENILTQNESILSYPGQILTCVFGILWTNNVAQAISNSDKDALHNLYEKETIVLEKLLELPTTNNLAKKDLINLNNLLLTQIHHLHTIDDLKRKPITGLNDFSWISQLKYDYSESNLTIKSFTHSLPYGYEYLGNVKRLVITPLTERCFQTLFLALNYQLGGHFSGSACSGKTETIKEFSKFLAKYHIVFSCSENIHHVVLSQFFKGTASSGAWCCLDNIDRINYETMSIIAQQIRTIQKRVQAKSEEINLEDFALKLDSNCAIFITTNPYQSNRIPLSNNLKVLFRSINLLTPDIQVILEIKLRAYGFQHAKSIAIKIHKLCELLFGSLSANQLPDFGLRTLKKVIDSAGSVRRNQSENRDEFSIIVQELNAFQLPNISNDGKEIYEGILRNLFPDAQPNSTDDIILMEIIKEKCKQKNKVCNGYVSEKLRDMIHLLKNNTGIIAIGDPFSGKSTCINLLQDILLEMELKENPTALNNVCIVNPKAVNLNQLYGFLDQESLEWKDGIVPIYLRKFSKSSSKKYIVFDSPMDPLWIDNLNTILDDNRNICLSSGEIVALPRDTKIIFESSDLATASPATISRCGIVSFSSQSLGWQVIFEEWKNTLTKNLIDSSIVLISQMVQRFCPVLLWFIRNRSAKELTKTSDANLVRSLLNLFECFLDDYYDDKYVATLSDFDVRAQLEGIFFFSCVWSLGGALNTESRKMFSELFQGLLEKKFPETLIEKFGIPNTITVPNLVKPYIFPIPKQNTVFDYKYVKEGKGKWKLWVDELSLAPAIPRDMAANEINITTPENLRIYYLMDLLVKHSKHFMLVGPTGTGKSVYILDYILKKMDQNKYLSQCLYFCALTTTGETQETVMAKLEKRKKNVFGPSMGKKCVYFVDDVSIPKREKYGAQPPIELLRMWLDHSIWYDHKDLKPMQLDDLQIICSMTSENHSNYISERFKRHFNILAIDEFSDDIVRSIFSKIILWHLDTRGFSKEFDPCIEEIVSSTLTIFKKIKQRIFPKPTSIQYMFNLRDFSKVIQGVLLSVPEATEDLNSMRRMWFHEVIRTFSDRIMEKDERKWLLNNMCEIAEQNMKLPIRELMEKYIDKKQTIEESTIDKIMFCDFTNPKADTRNYLEVQDFEELVNVVEAYLVEYNNMSKKPMNLIFFKYTIEHLSRICRIIKQPRNHALLLGFHGTGRQSMARLASHIADREIFQIEITQAYNQTSWSNDMKNILKRIASNNNLHAVFLLTDHQIKHDEFLKDIHNLMLSGEIPNLFEGDDKNEIIEIMRQIDQQNDKNVQTNGTPLALFNFFIRVIREQLHVVLSMSPNNKHFRNRIKSFPSIMKCCTIDWFEEWPDDAFVCVGQRFLSNVGLGEINADELINLSIHMHYSSKALAREYFLRFNRNYLVSPFSYLEFCRVYKKLFTDRHKELKKKELCYQKSISQIKNASEQIEKMQNRLKELEPKLKTIAETLAEQTVKVQEHSEVVVIERDKLNQFEAGVNNQTTELKAMQSEIDEKIEPHISKVESTLSTLKTISPSEFLIVKNLKSPPVPIKILLEGICILKDIKPDRNQAGQDDFWNPSKRLVTDMKFLENLILTNKDEIPTLSIEALFNKILRNEYLDYEKVKNFSPAFEALLNWLVAILRYHEEMLLLKDELAVRDQALGALNDNNNILNQMTERMSFLDNNSAENQRILDEQQEIHNSLSAEFDTCTIILERANNLISGIGNETGRWQESMEMIQTNLKNHIGDILLASGMITYLGPFTKELRQYLLADWIERCKNIELNCSKEFSLQKILFQYDDQKLDVPTDSYFIESTIIVLHSQRWPLMIDPQLIANNWIKLLEKKNRLCVIRLNEPDSYRILENSIQFGLPVLLEKLKEEFDPSMESVLHKQLFKQDGIDCVKLRESIVEYSENFRLYITTELENPTYCPENAMVINLVNFTMTREGLINKFLSITIARERPDLESEKKQLNTQFNNQEKQMNDIERNCLEILSSDESVLENERDVESLNNYYVTKLEILEKQSVIQGTRNHIDANRSGYIPISEHATNLYLTTSELSNMNFMYQYSLDWFSLIYTSSIDNSEKFDNITMRINEIKNFFTYHLFTTICQGLQDDDKKIYSFLLAVNLQNVDPQEFLFFLKVPQMNINRYNMESAFEEARKIFKEENMEFPENLGNDICIDPEPYQKLKDVLKPLQRLILIKMMRPSRLIYAIEDFVKENLDPKFTNQVAFDFIRCYEDSNNITPLLFIMDSDCGNPTKRIMEMAKSLKFSHEKIHIQSLNYSDVNSISKALETIPKTGNWLFIENIHVSNQGMGVISAFCENSTADNINPEFRLWLSSKPIPGFSKTLLQKSIKMIDKIPDGLKQSVAKISKSDVFNRKIIESCQQKPILQNFVQHLCLFHGVINERLKFGPIAWNRIYEFEESELDLSFQICVDVLNCFESPELGTIVYLIGECIYGGKVADERDRTLLRNLVEEYFGQDDLKSSEKKFSKVIASLTPHTNPTTIGLNKNMEDSKNILQTQQMMKFIMKTQDRKDRIKILETKPDENDVVVERIEKILEKLPEPVDLSVISTADEKDPLHSVFQKEMILYNTLLGTIQRSLFDIRDCLKGTEFLLLNFDEDIEFILHNKIPQNWLKNCFPTCKSLSDFIDDFIKRFTYFKESYENPNYTQPVWISGFYQIRSLFIGILQNFSKKHNIVMEDLELELKPYENEDEDGCVIVRGLFLEGASWNSDEKCLEELPPNQTIVELPEMLLRPIKSNELENNQYKCPMYLTSERKGRIFFSGLDSNYQETFNLNPGTYDANHWTKRGVAILTQDIN